MRKFKNTSTEKENEKTYFGEVVPMFVMSSLTQGQKVLTIEDHYIGVITGTCYDDIDDKKIYIVSVKRGTEHLRLKTTEIAQWFIYHPQTTAYLPLSFSDYDYIAEHNQVIIYRVTKRGYAKLVKANKKYYDWAKTLNRSKGGYKMYAILRRKESEIEAAHITN